VTLTSLRFLAAATALVLVVAACGGDPAETDGSDPTAGPTLGATSSPIPATIPTPIPTPSPVATPAPTPTPASPPSADPSAAASPVAGARVIEIQASGIRFIQGGEDLRDILVAPGETVVFRIDNVSGFDHNFYIGTDEQLRENWAETEIGIGKWDYGVQELEWTVPEDITDLKFGCTVPGHYALMQGTFSISE
jgi:hypothetical protein